MTARDKLLLRSLRGEALPTPPIWLMRQAGRYLPEYRATREKAGSFLDLCYNPELSTQVTLQPIRRFGFDGAILFADILLVPHALGAELGFVAGEGPKLSTVTRKEDMDRLKPADVVHETLSPVYETVRNLSSALPAETTLIGFAGAPWTVATYMIAGEGTKDQLPARRMILEDPDTFARLIDRITEATIAYLVGQVEAGAEAVKIFDSWAGSLSWRDFRDWCIEPNRRIVEALKARWPELPVIGFPRGAGAGYTTYARETGVDAVAIDSGVDPEWARDALQPICTVQGNLDPLHMVTGGAALDAEARRIVKTLRGGGHIFNLGHGITPEADPKNVERLIEVVRSA
jgi:uroporphyrinogen decarboxylase